MVTQVFAFGRINPQITIKNIQLNICLAKIIKWLIIKLFISEMSLK